MKVHQYYIHRTPQKGERGTVPASPTKRNRQQKEASLSRLGTCSVAPTRQKESKPTHLADDTFDGIMVRVERNERRQCKSELTQKGDTRLTTQKEKIEEGDDVEESRQV